MLYAVGLFVVTMIVLIGRNAWRQGEFRQFSVSLGIVLAVIAVIAGVEALWIALDR